MVSQRFVGSPWRARSYREACVGGRKITVVVGGSLWREVSLREACFGASIVAVRWWEQLEKFWFDF